MPKDDLVDYLFDGRSHALAAPMAAWLAASRRFTTFVNANHTKIRKKLRVSREAESLRDLQLELETAYLLLGERALNLEYEPGHPAQGRSPDFALSYTTSLILMVEVTRLRAGGLLERDRFTQMLCSKLGQLVPHRGNLLVVGVDPPHLKTDAELNAVMLRIQKRAQDNDSAVIQRHGFPDRAAFFRHYRRLSAILLRGGTPLQADEPVVLWLNPQAKYPLPAKVRTVLLRSHTL